VKAVSPRTTPRRTSARIRPPASPGQIAVIYRWGAWLLALGLIASGSTATFGRDWWRHGDVFLLVGLTLAVNVLLTLGLRPYMRLIRRYPPVLALDVLFCLSVYYHSNIWTSPFQFYSYASLMLPVAIFFFSGALVGSVLFVALNLILLYSAGDTLAWAQVNGWADTYMMQLAIVPLLAFVFAYPNRLYAQLRRAQQRLDRVERERLLAAERTRIAQSLHDSVAQMLFGIRLLAESAQARLAAPDGAPAPDPGDAPDAERAPLAGTLLQVRDLATRGNEEMRRAIYALNEPGVGRRGLPAALEALLTDLAARTGIAPALTISGIAAPREGAGQESPSEEDAASTPEGAHDAPAVALPEATAEALFHVAREALANVEKHAGAAHVWVEVEAQAAAGSPDGGQVRLVVRDDGRGFRRAWLAEPGDPDEDELGQMHFGMGNMRRAVEAVGGRLELTTGAGQGTTIVARVPPW
jgi:signal transduction histidine kinase